MGCDIHPHIEFKHHDCGYYEWFASPYIEQSYLLFALLAGVRAGWVERHLGYEIEAMFAPRGIPEDAAAETLRGPNGCDYWNADKESWVRDTEFHSGSWLSTEELRAVADSYFAFDGTDRDVELRAVISAMEALPQARFVFWFDN